MSHKTLEIAVITKELIYSNAMVTQLKLYWLQSGKGWGRDKIICNNSTTSKVILHFTCIFIQFFSYSQWEMIMINKFQLLKLFDNTIIINKGTILSTKLYYSNKFQHSTVDLEYCQNEKHFKSPDNLMTTDVNFFQKMRYLFTFSYLKQVIKTCVSLKKNWLSITVCCTLWCITDYKTVSSTTML